MSQVRGIFFVVLSIFVVTALVFTGFRLYRRLIADKIVRTKYEIQTIIQTGPEKEALPTVYLAELLGLSSDHPQNYFTFNEKEAEERLQKSPVIKKARVKKMDPDTIYIDYEVFKPVAKVKDWTNRALDEEGHTFPLAPFFSQKRLPEIYFGSKESEKGKFEIALAILAYLDHRASFEESSIQLIDVSQAMHESFGKREVVLTLEEKGEIWYLRLTPHKFPEELKDFSSLRSTYVTHANNKKVVDLRLPKVAYIEEIANE